MIQFNLEFKGHEDDRGKCILATVDTETQGGAEVSRVKSSYFKGEESHYAFKGLKDCVVFLMRMKVYEALHGVPKCQSGICEGWGYSSTGELCSDKICLDVAAAMRGNDDEISAKITLGEELLSEGFKKALSPYLTR